MTIIIFFIVLGILVFVHELGHFLVARAFGIRVDEFALGFGPKLWSKKVTSAKYGDVVYALNLIPFGGYVKIFGENPDDESISGPDSGRSFINKPRYAQAAVLVAGVTSNFLLAWIIFSAVFMAGSPVSPSSYPQYADRVVGDKVLISYIAPHSPAEAAGLAPGDTIISINGRDYATISDFQNAIYASAGQPIIMTTSATTTVITPVRGIVSDRYAIGISMADAGILRLPVHLAVWEGGKYTLHVIVATAVGLWDLIVGIFHGQGEAFASVSGPVGIAGLVADALHLGFIYLLTFTALISVNLGVLNLIPFPALDGGRLLFVIIESIIRRRIKPIISNSFNLVGFALLLLLMVVVTYNDIVRKWF